MTIITIHETNIELSLLLDIVAALRKHGYGDQSVCADEHGIYIGHDFEKQPAQRLVSEDDYNLIVLHKIRAGEFVNESDLPTP